MLILVDENDRPCGVMPKLQAHEQGALHRAFSVFIFNSNGDLLLQKRADSKYHSPGLWTNTCCSHPAPGQATLEAARRRLFAEMGIGAELTYVLKFRYKSTFANRLTEHEIDHIFIGTSDEKPAINPEEVSGFTYMPVAAIVEDMTLFPEKYTSWFRIIWERFLPEVAAGSLHFLKQTL